MGAQWVVAHADEALARAALDVLAKIAAIVPDDLRPLVDDPAVGTPPALGRAADTIDIARLREWSRTGRKLRIAYGDATGSATERVIHPFMVGYVATVRIVAAWCELRQDFRIFRTDRLADIVYLDERYRDHPVVLRRRWLAMMRERRKGSPPVS